MNFYLLALTRIHQSLPYDIYYPSSPKCFFFTQPNVICIFNNEVEVELDDEFDDDEQIEMGKGQKTESGFTLVSPACT